MRETLPGDRSYCSLDDLDVREQAERAPDDSVERGCLLLHAGERTEWLGPRILAVPWWRVV